MPHNYTPFVLPVFLFPTVLAQFPGLPPTPRSTAALSASLLNPLLIQAAMLTPSSPQTLTTLHNLTASLFGIGAGILGLESYPGFLFYIFFSLLTSALVYVFRVRPGIIKEAQSHGPSGMGRYFRSSLELWTGGLLEGLSGFVLTWTLFYGLVRA
jgi:hypothetical protein